MTLEQTNKTRVLEAFELLFNQKNFAAAEAYFSPNYIQHSSIVPSGRSGLFDLVRQALPTLRHEAGLVVAEGDLVMLQGRWTDFEGPKRWITVDIFRVREGVLEEHWDVAQQEVTKAESKSGLPMFGEDFGPTLSQ